MPPKARPLRRESNAARKVDKSGPPSSVDGPSPTLKASLAPQNTGEAAGPPSPATNPILGTEVQALEDTLKEAALNAGRIFRFYADTKKQRIVSHAPYPPKSLVRSLGRSLERYDQVCDAIETQLLHAMAIFERDLKAEQARLDAEASAAVAAGARSDRPSISPSNSRIPLPQTLPPPSGPDQLPLTDSPTATQIASQIPLSSATPAGQRRRSTILSALQRSGFPLKLDLSPATLAGHLDPTLGPPMDVNMDLGLTSLPSPVTLAPKTAARMMANEAGMPDIFDLGSSQGLAVDSGDAVNTGAIPGTVGMKTTQEDVIDLTGPEPSARGTAKLGDTADKPIELDLEGPYDDMDLFGNVEANDNRAGLADPTANAGSAAEPPRQLDIDMEELFTPRDDQANAFHLGGDMGQDGGAPDPGAILASLASGAQATGPNTGELSSLLPRPSGHPGQVHAGETDEASRDSFAALDSGDLGPQFDLSGIDLSSFNGLFDAQEGATREGDMDLMQLLSIDGGEHHVTPPALGT